MKSLVSFVCKLLILIAIAFAGYQTHPSLFPQKTAKAKSPQAPTPQPSTPPNQPKPELKTTPETTADTDTSNNIPAPPKKNSTANKTPSKNTPKETSPLKTATLTLIGKEALSTTELKKDEQLIKHACKKGEWQLYRHMLSRSLTEALAQSQSKLTTNNARYSPLWNEPRYYTALLRWKALTLLTDKVTSLTKTNKPGSAMMKWLLNNDNALEEVALTLHKKDDKKQVFLFLSEIWKNEYYTYLDSDEEFNKGDANDLEIIIPKYFNLALACAVVFDKKIPYKNKESLQSHLDGMFRYHWYRKKGEAGLLEGDIHKASARDLTFVVCAPVSKSELEWALSEYRSTRRKNIGKAYSDLEYLMERAVSGFDPYSSYTLPEILDKGGICGDQSFFCVNTARAAGIPAFGLSGITNSGGHAWSAVKIDKDEWSTQIGRIEGVAKGKGKDPQTGEAITEQQVWLWSEPKVASRTNTIKVYRHLWIADFLASNKAILERNQAILVANQIGKEFPITWSRAYQVMLTDKELTTDPTNSKTLTIWKDFVKELKHEFRKNPRMASLSATIEDKHIFPYSDLDDIRRELARLRRRDTKNAAEQADLMTSSLKRETELILKRGKADKDQALEEVHQLYSRSLREYGGSLTGFKDMIKYYFSIMKVDKERAKDSVRSIELAFGRVVDTGSDDWFRKNAEIDIHKLIAKMYRQVGEEKRATNMEKRLERDIKNAERDAL